MSVVERIEASLAGIEAELAERVRMFESEAEPAAVAELQRLATEAHERAASKSASRHPELTWVLSALGRAPCQPISSSIDCSSRPSDGRARPRITSVKAAAGDRPATAITPARSTEPRER